MAGPGGTQVVPSHLADVPGEGAFLSSLEGDQHLQEGLMLSVQPHSPQVLRLLCPHTPGVSNARVSLFSRGCKRMEMGTHCLEQIKIQGVATILIIKV